MKFTDYNGLQIEGVRFMWRNIVMIKQDSHEGNVQRYAGCILAHAMGLGGFLFHHLPRGIFVLQLTHVFGFDV